MQTQVTNLQATNTNHGVEIQNTGDLTLKSLGAGYAVQNPNGAVRIDSTGSITVSDAISAGKIVSLRANGNLLINANITSGFGGEGNPPSELIADLDNNGTGSITQNATSVITTNNNTLKIGIVCAPGDECGPGSGGTTQNIVLGRVNAGTGDVYIRTEDGGAEQTFVHGRDTT